MFQLPDTQQGGDAGASGDGAATAGSAGEPTQKKRKPILTLKTERVFSEKGLRYVEKEFPKLKFRGKGHEVSIQHLNKMCCLVALIECQLLQFLCEYSLCSVVLRQQT